MLDSDVVEAVIQLPTDEFFNTGIYTYLWVLNKNKQAHHKDKVMLINASDKFKPLKKSKGSKRKEVDAANRLEIVATLAAYQDNDYAKVFDKEFFYFNKQAIMLTNVDEYGNSFAAKLQISKTSEKLTPLSLSNGEREITEFVITNVESDNYRKVGERHGYMKVCEQNAEYASPSTSFKTGPTSLAEYFEQDIKPFIAGLDYKEQPLVITTSQGRYYFDVSQETLIKESAGKNEALGCGKIIVKSALKKASKTQAERIEITVELAPDYQKDYEIIPFHKDEAANRAAIEAFMVKYINKPFAYLENVTGVEINFNKIFYKPEELHEVGEILGEIAALDLALKALEAEMAL